MSFQFQKRDQIESLPQNIAKHLPNFVQKRIKMLSELEIALAHKNFQKIRNIAHRELGVAASYHCFQLEEIFVLIQDHARNDNEFGILEILPTLDRYLSSLELRLKSLTIQG